MRSVTSTVMACVPAGAVNLFAQEQAPPAQESKEAAAPKSTLIGCVVQAKPPTAAWRTCSARSKAYRPNLRAWRS